MTKKGTKTRLVRTEGPISDMDYHKVGTWPSDKPLPEIHPPWLKKGTKTIPSRTEGPISDMDYHKIGTVPPGTPLREIHPPWLEPQPQRTLGTFQLEDERMTEDVDLAPLARLLSDDGEEQPRMMRCGICGAMTEALPDYMPHDAISEAEAEEDGAEEAWAAMEAGAAHVCRPCALTVPPSLLKAAIDNPFDYALGLRSGHVLRFKGCQFHGAWVTIMLGEGVRSEPLGTHYTFDRGVDVRLDEIVWCADAPQGS